MTSWDYSNKTIFGAKRIHGSDPQHLIEQITRFRIYESIYWREKCYGLNAATIIDKAVELTHVGGHYGTQMPTQFLCLLLKLLQLQPEAEIINTFIHQADFKYLRALGVFYLRLVGEAVDVFQTLEPIYFDFRKLRYRRKGFEAKFNDRV